MPATAVEVFKASWLPLHRRPKSTPKKPLISRKRGSATITVTMETTVAPGRKRWFWWPAGHQTHPGHLGHPGHHGK